MYGMEMLINVFKLLFPIVANVDPIFGSKLHPCLKQKCRPAKQTWLMFSYKA